MKDLKLWELACLMAAAFLLFGGAKGCDGNLPDWFPVTASAPFKTDKPAVLLISESEDHGSYTADQRAVILSTRPESARVKVETKGGFFHVIDDDTPADKLALAPPWVQEAFKVPHASVPWIVGADSRTGFSVPLTTEADAIKRVEGLK